MHVPVLILFSACGAYVDDSYFLNLLYFFRATFPRKAKELGGVRKSTQAICLRL